MPDGAAASGAGEIDIQVEQFGLGDAVRQGSYAGVRLALRDRGDRVRGVIVRLHMRDPDGDTEYVERAITLNPGKAQGVWLYPRLPWDVATGSIYTVTVHAALEGVEADGSPRVGRQLGAARIAARSVVSKADEMLGVVGRQSLGLELYAAAPPGSPFPPTTHEFVVRVGDLTPAAMPDMWPGLEAMTSIIWADGEPGELSDTGAAAIREWVNRGGQLVIILPPAGQTWTSARANPLLDLMPAAEIQRHEEVELGPYRRMLTIDAQTPMPERAIVHTFVPMPGARPDEAIPILAGPDRACVVIRRLVGAGMVTVVGFDLASPRLAGKIDPRALWHRILGRRGDTLSVSELAARSSSRATADFTNRQPVWLDADLGELINMTSDAGKGVLLALIVFAGYLVLAGPGGYAMLKKRGLKRHAWVAFVAIAGLFTLVAWGGASALRKRTEEVRHLSVIDHVYGQPVDSAHTWFSVFLPTYGDVTVSIGRPSESGERDERRNALAPWQDPDGAAEKSFPDTRGYAVDMQRLNTLTVPARSTVKQFRADWLGGPPWKMPTPEAPIGLDENGRIRGVLSHGLPGSLENVELVLVARQRPYPEQMGEGGPLLAQSIAVRLKDPWPPGTPLDLGAQFQGQSQAAGDQYFSQLAQARSRFAAMPGGLEARSAPERLSILAWHAMLEPPDWRRNPTETKLLIQRRESHGLDLGKWFTQPCLIIVGQIADGPSPTPIFVDGRAAASSGRTVVRWIYPLPAAPVSPDN